MPSLSRICVLAVPALTALAQPVHAQSFLEKLFGLGTQPAELPPPMPSYRAPIRISPPRTYTSGFQSELGARRARKVRTVCVRLCDGYYFPISHSTSTPDLVEDSDRCKASCGSDARLFYSDSGDDPDPASMVDLTGRRYDALETAFAYRSTLHPGCSCKPPPWSSWERLRHFKYALEQAQTEVKMRAVAEIKPGATASGSVAAAHEAISDAAAAAQVDQDNTVAPDDARDTRVPIRTRHETSSTAGERPSERTAQRLARKRPPMVRQRYSKAAWSSGLGGFFGFGQNQNFAWPGNAR